MAMNRSAILRCSGLLRFGLVKGLLGRNLRGLGLSDVLLAPSIGTRMAEVVGLFGDIMVVRISRTPDARRDLMTTT